MKAFSAMAPGRKVVSTVINADEPTILDLKFWGGSGTLIALIGLKTDGAWYEPLRGSEKTPFLSPIISSGMSVPAKIFSKSIDHAAEFPKIVPGSGLAAVIPSKGATRYTFSGFVEFPAPRLTLMFNLFPTKLTPLKVGAEGLGLSTLAGLLLIEEDGVGRGFDVVVGVGVELTTSL
jgi:hypothetical protein